MRNKKYIDNKKKLFGNSVSSLKSQLFSFNRSHLLTLVQPQTVAGPSFCFLHVCVCICRAHVVSIKQDQNDRKYWRKVK